MPVLPATSTAFRREYGIDCLRHFPRPDLATPFGATYCVVRPGEATAPHQHHEGEVFHIATGHGRVEIAGEPAREVGPGDAVYLPSHATHQLHNTGDADLTFFSTWWEDAALAATAAPARRLVLVAPPTPNGDLHLGHLAGPYLAADAHARHLRMRGTTARYLTGADEHQSYVAKAAEAAGTTPGAVAKGFGDGIAATLEAFGVDLARFETPGRADGYAAFTRAFFGRLVETGAIVRQHTDVLWCACCEQNLFDAWVSGGCPHCGEATSGNGCEACFRPNDCADLVDPRCARCGTPASRRRDDRWVFPLEPHRAFLAAFWERTAMAPHLRALAATLAAGELPAVGVSHRAAWGIPAPELAGHVIYEWLEMAAGFLFTAAEAGEAGAWTDAATDVVQFFGMDNAFFFLTLLPAALHAFDPAIRMPTALHTNEFYRLDGLKFSTSRRHAIWGDEALAQAPADAWRLVLAADRPEHAQTSFGLADAAAFARRELAEGWGGWLRELEGRGAVAPSPEAPSPEALDSFADVAAFRARVREHLAALAHAYGDVGFSTRRVVRALIALAADAREFGAAQAVGTRREAALAAELAAARAFALGLWPLAPGFAGQLLAALGEDGVAPRWDATAAPLPAGTALGDLAGVAATFEAAAADLARFAARAEVMA